VTARTETSPAEAWLDAHQGETFTTDQFAEGAGITRELAAVILREASDRDWIDQLPGGWRVP
jgi:hypothetical protein